MGLTKLPREDLEALLRLLHRDELELPLTRQYLLTRGFHRLAEHGALLLGLEEPAVRAVLVAVIAERRALELRS